MQRVLQGLHKKTVELGSTWGGIFKGLFNRVDKAVQEDAVTEELKQKVDKTARLAYLEHFEASAEAQAVILGASRVAKNVLDIGVTQAKKKGAFVAERALAVLGRNKIAVESYAEIVVGELGMTALNEAFAVVSVAEDATHKQFKRIGKSTVERSHSVLEGRVIPIGENFIMDGYSVPFPHHPSLPLKHRINCKHAVVGVKLRGRGKGIITRIEGFGRRVK